MHACIIIGSRIGVVAATDADEDELTYSLQPSSSDSQYFLINSSTGVISNAISLDREVSLGE